MANQDFPTTVKFPAWANCLTVDSDGQSWYNYAFHLQLERFHEFDEKGENVKMVKHWVTREIFKPFMVSFIYSKQVGPKFPVEAFSDQMQVVPAPGWVVVYESVLDVLTAKLSKP